MNAQQAQSPEHATAWLHHVRDYLAEKSTRYERVLLQLLDEYLACPDAEPSPLVALLDELRLLQVEEGRLDDGLMDVRQSRAAIWNQIEATKGGAEA